MTTEDKQRLTELFNAGKTDKEISQELHYSQVWTRKVRESLGLSRWKTMAIRRFKMIADGKSYQDIAEIEGIDADSVYRWLCYQKRAGEGE